MSDSDDRRDWRWVILGATWLYGTGVAVFASMPALTEWYDTIPSESTIKWLYAAAVIAHLLLFLGYSFIWHAPESKSERGRGRPRSTFTWHHGASAFLYAWPTIAAFVHASKFADSLEVDVAFTPSIRAYVLWKCVVGFGVAVWAILMADVCAVIRTHFEHRGYQRV